MSSVFIDKNIKPDNQMLADKLGSSYKLWQKIKTSLTTNYCELNED